MAAPAITERPCRFCHELFEPREARQTVCLKPECRRALNSEYAQTFRQKKACETDAALFRRAARTSDVQRECILCEEELRGHVERGPDGEWRPTQSFVDEYGEAFRTLPALAQARADGREAVAA